MKLRLKFLGVTSYISDAQKPHVAKWLIHLEGAALEYLLHHRLFGGTVRLWSSGELWPARQSPKATLVITSPPKGCSFLVGSCLAFVPSSCASQYWIEFSFFFFFLKILFIYF